MANNIITINQKPTTPEDIGARPVQLNNGNLVLHYDRDHNLLGAYIVTSFRDGKRRYDLKTNTAVYCSLVSLSSGNIAFEERASRSTTVKRVLSHLNHCTYGGDDALRTGQTLEVFKIGSWGLDLQANPSANLV